MKKIYHLFMVLLCFSSEKLLAQCITPATIPFYESFSGITANNQLPPCWAASNLSVTCLTHSAATAMQRNASFYYSPAGTSYFYSPAFQMLAGVSYSVFMFYKTSTTNTGVTWTSLSVLLGTSQNSTGLTPIATHTNPLGLTYQLLSGTFTVPTNGVYYFAIEGKSNGASGPPELIWDDFNVIIPCSFPPNTPTITTVVSNGTPCANESVSIAASGAGSYTWSTGENTSVVTVTPQGGNHIVTYTVSGTRAASGCTVSQIVTFGVKLSPVISAIAFPTELCIGDSVNLLASGTALTYTWSTGLQGASAIIKNLPLGLSTWSVTGTNTYSCSSIASVNVMVNPLPVITVSSSVSSGTICQGDEFVLTLGGATSYSWNNIPSASVFSLSVNASSEFTVVGKDDKGCLSTSKYMVYADECTGIDQLMNPYSIKIYPNPGTGNFMIESGSARQKFVSVFDMTGRVIFSTTSTEDLIPLDLAAFSEGIYQVKILSEKRTEYKKLIKQ